MRLGVNQRVSTTCGLVEPLWLMFLGLKSKFKPGYVFWNFVFFEGLGRIFVDFYRQDILYYGFSVGQWFSLLMVLAATWMFIKHYSGEWKKIFS